MTFNAYIRRFISSISLDFDFVMFDINKIILFLHQLPNVKS